MSLGLNAALAVGAPTMASEPHAGDVLFLANLIVKIAVVNRQMLSNVNVPRSPNGVLVGSLVGLPSVGIARVVLETVKTQVFHIVGLMIK